jgi:uncharacterized membrane protein
MRTSVLSVHIVAGSLGLLSGFVALYAAKGASVHRRSGTLFVYAMLTMSLVGSAIALLWNVAPEVNAPVGFLTAYLVITALSTVKPTLAASRRASLVLMMVPAVVGVALLSFAFRAVASPTGTVHGMPAAPFFVFAVIAALAIAGDVRLLRSGGVHSLRGAPRLTRHLWRMSVALLIAAFSFFLGQAKVIPKPIRIYPLLLVPPLLVLGTLVYWLWRVRIRRSLRNMIVTREPAVTGPFSPARSGAGRDLRASC